MSAGRHYAEWPDVSVIMPVKDTSEALVHDAVASVLSQDHPGRIELVAWDDGSADPTTVAAVAGLSRREVPSGRTVVVGRSETNRGISDARNQASLLARGRWLIWLDSDDVLPPEAIRLLLAAAGDDTQLVVGQCAVRFPDGRGTTHRNADIIRTWLTSRSTRQDPLLTTVFAVHGALVRRTLFWKLAGFDTRISHGELTDWFLRVLASVTPAQIALVNDVTYRYYKRGSSHSADRDVLEWHRRDALWRYSEAVERTLPHDFRIVDRCERSGARGYERIDSHGETLTEPFTIGVEATRGMSATARKPLDGRWSGWWVDRRLVTHPEISEPIAPQG